MFEFVSAYYWTLWTIFWQSTACLVIGMLLGRLLGRQPALAHQALRMAVLASILTPAVTLLYRWAPAANVLADTRPDSAEAMKSWPPDSLGLGLGVICTSKLLILVFWMNWSAALLDRLYRSYKSGSRFARGASPVVDYRLADAEMLATGRLQVMQRFRLRSSHRVRCPAIWCWGRRPIVLVPEGTRLRASAADWSGVMTHELAHWKRRDHVSALVAEIVAALLPWHPLVRWCNRRLRLLAEQACDDWALATGTDNLRYATTLLDLAPEPSLNVGLTAVSTRSNLAVRIRHILGRQPRPAHDRYLCRAIPLLLCVAWISVLVGITPAAVRIPEGARLTYVTSVALSNAVSGAVSALAGPDRYQSIRWASGPSPLTLIRSISKEEARALGLDIP